MILADTLKTSTTHSDDAPLTRRIVLFNLVAVVGMFLALLYFMQREGQVDLTMEARMLDGSIETVPAGRQAWIFKDGVEVDSKRGPDIVGPETPLSDGLSWVRTKIADFAPKGDAADAASGLESGGFGHQILDDGRVLVLTMTDNVELRKRQETLLRVFIAAVLLSILLSIILSNSISEPIRNLTKAAQARVDGIDTAMPDMDGRPDEIGRLSAAMKEMTEALYERVATNEQFAADVAHEVKNPLASLRSAVETLRIAPEGAGRVRLLDVIEHDVRRLDRLVSDISNASRLDTELVKDTMVEFDIADVLNNIVMFHKYEADAVGVELIWNNPDHEILCNGLEERLAQVFVNLLTNAISFCEDGDAIRIWIRQREDRTLIVFEDTGPGIPEDGLPRIFDRFYSERPEESFGNHSGLGLSISKQIVEAHGGVIWAENIYDKDEGPEGGSLGARFVIGLPT